MPFWHRCRFGTVQLKGFKLDRAQIGRFEGHPKGCFWMKMMAQNGNSEDPSPKGVQRQFLFWETCREAPCFFEGRRKRRRVTSRTPSVALAEETRDNPLIRVLGVSASPLLRCLGGLLTHPHQWEPEPPAHRRRRNEFLAEMIDPKNEGFFGFTMVAVQVSEIITWDHRIERVWTRSIVLGAWKWWLRRAMETLTTQHLSLAFLQDTLVPAPLWMLLVPWNTKHGGD